MTRSRTDARHRPRGGGNDGGRSGADDRGRDARPRRRSGRAGGRSGTPRVEVLTGIHCVREAIRARRRELLRLRVDAAARRGAVAALCDEADRIGLPVSEESAGELAERLDAATRRSNPQGVLLEAGPVPLVALEDLLASLPEHDGCLVALDEVEDPQNVGALVRVAEGAGAAGLLLPDRRSPPLGPTVARASAGALEWLPVVRVPNLARALDTCRAADAWLVGADQEADASLFEVEDRILSGRLVVVMGAEGRGLREGIRRRVDHALSIPMMGRVDSLNVSAAGAVVLYELLRRRVTGGSAPRG